MVCDVDFVVVRHDEPGEGRMRRLQVRVALVQRIAPAVAGETHDFRSVVLPHRQRVLTTLIDVIAKMNDEIEVFERQVPVGGIKPLLPVLARDKREPKLIGRSTSAWQRACPSDWAAVAANGELVVVPAIR
jgi:hypothetical protein